MLYIHPNLYNYDLTNMNDYDLLGLIDTYNAMKRDKVPNTPASLMDFLSGLSPISDDELPQEQTE